MLVRHDLLDRIDPQRHDVDALLKRLNEFERLSPDEQNAHESIWLATGLAEAEHPLSALCGEAHNAFCIVRDLNGELRLIFETAPGSGRWEAGLVYQQHISDLALGDLDDEGLEAAGIPLMRARLDALIESLPVASSPVRSF